MRHLLKPLACFFALTTFSLARAEEATPTVTPQPTLSESQPVTMEEIDVSTKRVGIGRKEITGDDAQDIRNNGDLGAVLDHESGLETQGEGLGKSWNTLAIRGQSFRETVILINGQRVPESFNLGTIPTESIEKVEVLEGPQALAYGSDALGGVLNIITREADSQPWSLGIGGGDFNTYQFQGSTASFKIGGVQNVLSGSYFTTDGYLPPDPATGLGFTDEVHWDISHCASWSMGESKASLSSVFFRHVGSAPDADNVVAAGTDQYDLDGRQDAWGIQSSFRDESPLGGGWKLVPALSGDYSDVIRNNPIGKDPTSGLPYRNQYLDYGGQVYVSGPAGGFLDPLGFGLEAREEGLWSGFYGNPSRWAGSVVAQGTLKFSNPLRLEVVNRLDNYSTYGLTDNPTGTLVFNADPHWQIHLSAGKGYKIPTFDQLYLPPTAFAGLNQFAGSPFQNFNGDEGNPRLSPEQSIDWELGTDITVGNFLFQLAGFLNFYQNLINPVLDPADNYWTYTNIDQALFAGTEDNLKYHLTDVFLPYLSATYISATDQEGNPIQGRMHFKFAAGVEVKPEKQWSLDLNGRYIERYPVAAQYLTDFYQNNGIPVSPANYWDFGVEAKYTISAHLKGFLTVENLLNDSVASFQGLPYPGRTFQGGLQSTF